MRTPDRATRRRCVSKLPKKNNRETALSLAPHLAAHPTLRFGSYEAAMEVGGRRSFVDMSGGFCQSVVFGVLYLCAMFCRDAAHGIHPPFFLDRLSAD